MVNIELVLTFDGAPLILPVHVLLMGIAVYFIGRAFSDIISATNVEPRKREPVKQQVKQPAKKTVKKKVKKKKGESFIQKIRDAW